GKPDPFLCLRYFIQKRDPYLTQKMPGTVTVAAVRSPEVPGIEVIVHLSAPYGHHLAAFLLLRLAEQIIDKGVGAGEIIVIGHSCFIRSEEHTSELQSRENLVCRLLLEKKKTAELYCSILVMLT